MSIKKGLLIIGALLGVCVIILGAIGITDTYPVSGPFAINALGQVFSKYDSNNNLKTVENPQAFPPIDLHFQQLLQETTLADDAIRGSYDILVSSVSGVTVGNYIGLFTSGEQGPLARFFHAEALGISGTTITLDSPIDFGFVSGSKVTAGERDISTANGSVTPVFFDLFLYVEDTDLAVDITRLNFGFLVGSIPLLSDFGDIDGGLTRGIVLQHMDDRSFNLENIKDNYGLGLYGGFTDLKIFTAIGQGTDAIGQRVSYGGNDKHGTPIRLLFGEKIRLIVQDDLTGLTSFEIVAQGYIVDPT